jgi:hypothetical protein
MERRTAKTRNKDIRLLPIPLSFGEGWGEALNYTQCNTTHKENNW